MVISIIAAIGKNKEIGYRGHIPWNLPTDSKRFRSLTEEHTVIMGKKTFESIGKPLPNRTNIILTKNSDYSQDGCLVTHSFETAITLIPIEESEAFIIGGAAIYAIALQYAAKMYITEVSYSGSADTYFPDFDKKEWKLTSSTLPTRTKMDNYDFRFDNYIKSIKIDTLTK